MIQENNLEALGDLLFEAHYGAQHQFKISCKELDFLVEQAKESPHVIGARMMGGGFGGCTINILKNEAVQEFTQQISKVYKETFGIKNSIYFIKFSKGTRILEYVYRQ